MPNVFLQVREERLHKRDGTGKPIRGRGHEMTRKTVRGAAVLQKAAHAVASQLRPGRTGTLFLLIFRAVK